MRSMLPMFLLFTIALIAVIGVMIFGYSATSASVEVNNTSTEELPVAIFDIQTTLVYGIAGFLFIIAIYIALKSTH